MDSGTLLAALVIIALVCPISMWLMMRGRSRETDEHAPKQEQPE